MEDCIFCRIVERKIPADIVHDDDRVMAFKDINPKAPIHLLVIPKQHISSLDALQEEDAETMGHLILVLRQLARQFGIADRGYRVLVNCGPEGGQEVFHLHFHLLGGRPLGAMIPQPGSHLH